MKIAGFGALNMDRVMMVDRFPSFDEETLIRSIRLHPGGSAANTISGLARLGMETGFLGKVGRDEDGKLLIDSFRREKVNTDGISIGAGNSGATYIFVDRKGRRAILVEPGVNDEIGRNDIDMDYVESFDWLHLTSFACKKTEKSFRTQLTVAKKFSGEISLDPGNIYAGFGLKKILPLIKNSSIVLPSKDEIEILTGLPYKDACNLLISEGVKIVAVKYGGRGCYITDGKMKVSIPAFRTQVVDTTGAGDAFCAGFLYGIAKGKSLKECGRIANKVASFCISGPGARFLPRLSDL